MHEVIKLILFIIGSIGLTNIIVDSSLFKPVRESFKNWNYIYELLTCHLCSGMWSGLLCGWLLFGTSWTLLIYGFSASFLEGSIVHYIGEDDGGEIL